MRALRVHGWSPGGGIVVDDAVPVPPPAAVQSECVALFNEGRIEPVARAVLSVKCLEEAARLVSDRGGFGRALFTF
jgi:hypothetical protein